MKKIMMIIVILVLTGCTRDIVLKDDDLTQFQTLLVSETGIENIEVHIVRPQLTWDVSISDKSKMQMLFDEIVDFMRKDEWLMLLKDDYYITDLKIDIINTEGKSVIEYTSSYYVPGTTIYGDEKKNEIDGFVTWYSSDGATYILDESY